MGDAGILKNPNGYEFPRSTAVQIRTGVGLRGFRGERRRNLKYWTSQATRYLLIWSN